MHKGWRQKAEYRHSWKSWSVSLIRLKMLAHLKQASLALISGKKFSKINF